MLEKLEKKIDQCRNRLIYYVGNEQGKVQIQSALLYNLERYSVSLSIYANELRDREGKAYYFNRAFSVELEYLELADLLNFKSTKKAIAHHRIASIATQLFHLSFEINESILDLIKTARKHIAIACQLDPSNENHFIYAKKMDDQFIDAIKKMLLEKLNFTNFIRLNTILLTIYEDTRRYEEAAHVAHRISSGYCDGINASLNLIADINEAIFFIKKACSLDPDATIHEQRRKQLLGNFIKVINGHVYQDLSIEETVSANFCLLNLQQELESNPYKEANIYHAISSLYLKWKSQFSQSDLRRKEFTYEAYRYANYAYQLDPENHISNLVAATQAYAHHIRDGEPAKAFELFKYCLQFENNKNVSDLTKGFCHDGLARLYLNSPMPTEETFLSAEHHYSLAIKYKELAKEEASKDSSVHMLITTLLELGLFYEKAYRKMPSQQLFKLIKNTYFEALKVAEDHREPRKLGLVNNRLGYFYRYYLNDVWTASEYHSKAAELLGNVKLDEKSNRYGSLTWEEFYEVDTKYAKFIKKIITDGTIARYKNFFEDKDPLPGQEKIRVDDGVEQPLVKKMKLERN